MVFLRKFRGICAGRRPYRHHTGARTPQRQVRRRGAPASPADVFQLLYFPFLPFCFGVFFVLAAHPQPHFFEAIRDHLLSFLNAGSRICTAWQTRRASDIPAGRRHKQDAGISYDLPKSLHIPPQGFYQEDLLGMPRPHLPPLSCLIDEKAEKMLPATQEKISWTPHLGAESII